MSEIHEFSTLFDPKIAKILSDLSENIKIAFLRSLHVLHTFNLHVPLEEIHDSKLVQSVLKDHSF